MQRSRSCLCWFPIYFANALLILLLVYDWWAKWRWPCPGSLADFKSGYLYRYYYNGVIMGAMVSQITSLTIVYSTVYWRVHQRKHQRSASLAFVRGIHRWPVNSLRKWPVYAENVSIWWRHHETSHGHLLRCLSIPSNCPDSSGPPIDVD